MFMTGMRCDRNALLRHSFCASNPSINEQFNIRIKKLLGREVVYKWKHKTLYKCRVGSELLAILQIMEVYELILVAGGKVVCKGF